MKSGREKILKDTDAFLKYLKRYNGFPLDNDKLFIEGILKKLEDYNSGNDIQLNTSEKNDPSGISDRVSEVSLNSKGTDGIKEYTAGNKKDINIINTDNKNYSDLSELNGTVSKCTKCGILSGRRKNTVFGSGDENADLVIVGEAPGADEDEQGLPFVGRAGRLLTDILKAINFSREEVYICNILKCRPPDNRNPMPDEIENCEPYLFTQLKLIKPKLILAVGTFAAQTLLRSKEPLGKLRGRFHVYEGIKMMVTYHPAALLRNPNWKKPTWEDVKMLRAEYDKMKNIN
ncbi:MAG: uracil-DNA glycosylase [Bacteroidetes bacterium]|nr:uracil-DNA glycosylase [Bacteroidota bacterium]